jgi:hypothetical protein
MVQSSALMHMPSISLHLNNAQPATEEDQVGGFIQYGVIVSVAVTHSELSSGFRMPCKGPTPKLLLLVCQVAASMLLLL